MSEDAEEKKGLLTSTSTIANRHWFPSPNFPAKIKPKKGVHYNKSGNEIISCLFCRIAAKDPKETQLFYDDDDIVMFYPRKVFYVRMLHRFTGAVFPIAHAYVGLSQLRS